MSTDRTEDARPARILYTAEAVVQGGRNGVARTSDGRLVVSLSVPKELGGEAGGNGHQSGATLCPGLWRLLSQRAAGGGERAPARCLRLTITARVGIGPTAHGGTGLAVTLDLSAPQVTRAEAEDLMRRAHERCPYSRATRGNIDVTLLVDGTPAEHPT